MLLLTNISLDGLDAKLKHEHAISQRNNAAIFAVYNFLRSAFISVLSHSLKTSTYAVLLQGLL